MDEVLRALGDLALQAIPTFLLVAALHWYLKRVFFGPMTRVLAERHEATEGARKQAEESLEKASQKAVEYEAALAAARNEIYREQEELRLKLGEEHGRAILEARHNAEAQVKEAGNQLAAEVESARQSLALHADALAGQIAESVLRRKTV
jgi:F-type H+-transporting ATPase subunit b